MIRYRLAVIAFAVLAAGCDTASRNGGGSGARDGAPSKQADEAKIKKAEKELNKKGP